MRFNVYPGNCSSDYRRIYLHCITKRHTFTAMKQKAHIDTKKLKVANSGDSEAKVVKSYRIEPAAAESAEALCQAQHGRGLSSFVGDLVKSYFGLDKKKS
jgi:hypothetical protein